METTDERSWSSVIQTLRHISSVLLNIKACATILYTLSVTTCSAERSFSALKRIKTSFRSTMTNERLSGLTLLNVHRDIAIDIPAAINHFARLHPRRIRMIEMLANVD